MTRLTNRPIIVLLAVAFVAAGVRVRSTGKADPLAHDGVAPAHGHDDARTRETNRDGVDGTDAGSTDDRHRASTPTGTHTDGASPEAS